MLSAALDPGGWYGMLEPLEGLLLPARGEGSWHQQALELYQLSLAPV